VSELIVRELRLRAFDRVAPAVLQPSSTAESGGTPVAAPREVAAAERLVERHSRRRATPGELVI
jgi:hypothetical protein